MPNRTQQIPKWVEYNTFAPLLQLEMKKHQMKLYLKTAA